MAGEGTGVVAKTTVMVGQDGQTHAESFIETFDMGKDLQEKVKRTRKSRERRSNMTQAKQTQHQHDQNQGLNGATTRQNYHPSAPPMNQIDNIQYGKLQKFT